MVPAICLMSMNWGNPLNNTVEDIRNETRTFIYSAIASDPGPLHFVIVTESWNTPEVSIKITSSKSRAQINFVPPTPV